MNDILALYVKTQKGKGKSTISKQLIQKTLFCENCQTSNKLNIIK